MKGQTELKTTN